VVYNRAPTEAATIGRRRATAARLVNDDNAPLRVELELENLVGAAVRELAVIAGRVIKDCVPDADWVWAAPAAAVVVVWTVARAAALNASNVLPVAGALIAATMPFEQWGTRRQ